MQRESVPTVLFVNLIFFSQVTGQKKPCGIKKERAVVKHLGCFSLVSLVQLLGQDFEKLKWKLGYLLRGFYLSDFSSCV